MYGLAAYLFPMQVGPGKFEILGKYAKADFTRGAAPSYNQKTTEINFNYIIKEFNARVMQDDRVECVLLTVRDGILLVRKR